MSVPVELEALAAYVARLGANAFLVTSATEGPPHVASVVVRCEGLDLVMGAGRRSTQNAQSRSIVTLLWPDADDGKHCLLVDGVASATDSGALTVRPTSAILHRVAGAGP